MPKTKPTPPTISVRDFSKRVGMPLSTVKWHMNSGKIKTVLVTKQIRTILESEVGRMLEDK